MSANPLEFFKSLEELEIAIQDQISQFEQNSGQIVEGIAIVEDSGPNGIFRYVELKLRPHRNFWRRRA